MLSFIKNLFGRKQPSFWNAHRTGARRGGIALGTIASIAAPFIIRKLRARHAQQPQMARGGVR